VIVDSDMQWSFACKLDQIPVGGMRRVRAFDSQVLLARPEPDTVFAIEPWCPHNMAPLEHGVVRTDAPTLVCPEHAMEIDLRTGRNLCGPHGALGEHFEQNWVFPTKVDAGRVYVQLKSTTEVAEYYATIELPGSPADASAEAPG
jgi:nitrite reductase/ring-hydroxylating ferredoxin subunit